MSTAGMNFKRLTDEQRDNVFTLCELGLQQQEVAKILGIGKATVGNIKQAVKYAKDDNWDGLREMVDKKLASTVEWALKHEGKKLPPKEEPKPVPQIVLPLQETQKKMDLAEVKRIMTEVVAENVKDARIEQIDKDQMARVMYALAKIDERLETIGQWLETMKKEQNANADNLYKLIATFNNSVILELRKRK